MPVGSGRTRQSSAAAQHPFLRDRFADVEAMRWEAVTAGLALIAGCSGPQLVADYVSSARALGLTRPEATRLIEERWMS